ncbi:MAG: hypothetical protein KIS66_12025 [Fimbriimonadaceae bacterium]|nr:hypothetical protein [Fimbriimonadaceae bacterium]
MHEHEPFDEASRAYRNLESARERRRGGRVAVVRLTRNFERVRFALRLAVVMVLFAFAAAILLRVGTGPEPPLRALPPGLAP